MNLDIRTVYVLITIVSALMSFSLIYTIGVGMRKGDGIVAAILVIHTVAGLLMGARGIVPDLLSIHAAVILYAVAFSMSYLALCRFFARPVNRPAFFLPIAAMIATTHFVHDLTQRIVYAGLFYGVQHLIVIVALVRIRAEYRGRALDLIFLCNIIACATFFTRMTLAFAFPESFATLFSGNIMQSATMLLLFSSLFFYMLGFILLRLEWEATQSLMANRDLDERNRSLSESREHLREALEAGESANRAREEFFARMSHEVRTPMNAILGFTELLRLKITDARQREYLDAIATGGKRLMELLSDILRQSRSETGRVVLQLRGAGIADIARALSEGPGAPGPVGPVSIEIRYDPAAVSRLLREEPPVRQVLLNLDESEITAFDSAGDSLYCFCSTTPSHDKPAVVLVVGDKNPTSVA